MAAELDLLFEYLIEIYGSRHYGAYLNNLTLLPVSNDTAVITLI